jgi:hypothetical protein
VVLVGLVVLRRTLLVVRVARRRSVPVRRLRCRLLGAMAAQVVLLERHRLFLLVRLPETLAASATLLYRVVAEQALSYWEPKVSSALEARRFCRAPWFRPEALAGLAVLVVKRLAVAHEAPSTSTTKQPPATVR